jgi:hypothetical protein
VIVFGAVLLLASLFLPWSHQLSPQLLGAVGRGSPALFGVPANASGWQVYAAADVVLAVLAAALAAAGLFGARATLGWAAAGAAVAIAFVIHAISVPPTKGILIAHQVHGTAQYLPDTAGSGAGETVALIGLVIALLGLLAGALGLVGRAPAAG